MNIQTFLININEFLNTTIVPFLLSVAFLVFIWNVTRYFIIGGSNSDAQEKARSLALWGIIAFVVILSLWGIVNLLVSGFGLGNRGQVTPDYMESKGVQGTSFQENRTSNEFDYDQIEIRRIRETYID